MDGFQTGLMLLVVACGALALAVVAVVLWPILALILGFITALL